MRSLYLGLIATLCTISIAPCWAEASIFDRIGIGREVIPTVGRSPGLCGATLASEDPSTSSIIAPFSSVNAGGVVISGGYQNMTTKSKHLTQHKRGVETIFPSLSVVVPWKGVWIMTGLYQERVGKLYRSDEDTCYSLYVFKVEEKRETSIHSVPILASFKPGQRVIVSGGLIISFLDIRQETRSDFADDSMSDTKDIYDASADGKCLAAGILVDLGRIRLGSFYRSPTDLGGQMEWQNRYSGIYRTTDFSVRAKHGLSTGIMFKPRDWLNIELDYYRSPWSNLKADRNPINNRLVERWSGGLIYSGDHIWQGSSYPLYMGFYTQPIDWIDDATGSIRESGFSIGSSLAIGDGRALISGSLVIGKRKARKEEGLEEDFLGLVIGIAAIERWQRAETR